MNIFYLADNPEENAAYHVDKHVVKMITEYAQLLSTAVRISGLDAGYKITHKNHPSAIWVRESIQNWFWLAQLAYYLNKEYRYRYDKTVNHKSFDIIESLPTPVLPNIGLTKFRLAMPDDVKQEDPIESYRNYYINYKQHIASWKKREIPSWFMPR